MRLFRSRKGEAEPVPAPASASEPVPITWPKQLGGGRVLADDTRLQLIKDLGLVGGSWCVPLLERALEEETSETHRQAIARSLDACRSL